MGKIVLRWFILFCTLSIMTYGVGAIGISPATISVKYTPDSQQDLTLTAINNDQGERVVSIGAGGELGTAIHCVDKSITLKQGESRDFHCMMTLPHTLEAGDHDARIRVTSNPPQSAGAQGATVGGIAAVEAIIGVKVPFVGPWLSLRLETWNVLPGESGEFKMTYNSIGTETAEGITTTFDILNKDNVSAQTFSVDPFSLAAGDSLTKNFTFDTSQMAQGAHTIHGVTSYSGKTMETNKGFIFGQITLEIVSIKPVKILESAIAKLSVDVKNVWDRDVKANVHIDILKGSTVVGKATADPVTILGLQQRTIDMYADTADIAQGTYDLRAVVEYEGRKAEKIERSALMITTPKQKLPMTWILLIVILILVAIIILLRLTRDKEPKEKQPLKGPEQK